MGSQRSTRPRVPPDTGAVPQERCWEGLQQPVSRRWLCVPLALLAVARPPSHHFRSSSRTPGEEKFIYRCRTSLPEEGFFRKGCLHGLCCSPGPMAAWEQPVVLWLSPAGDRGLRDVGVVLGEGPRRRTHVPAASQVRGSRLLDTAATCVLWHGAATQSSQRSRGTLATHGFNGGSRKHAVQHT